MRNEARRLITLFIAMMVAAFFYHYFFLNTFEHWWVDDDPYVFAYAAQITNPLRFIADREVMHNFAAPNTVMSMSAISMWIDGRVAYRSVRTAEIHNAFSLSVVLLLLFLNLRKWGLSGISAALATLVWLLLPSTVVVNGLLAARHHLEGLLWSLVAVLVAQQLVMGKRRQRTGRLCLLLLFIALACLSKETYAICLPAFLFLYLWGSGLRGEAWWCVSPLPVYFVYRWWAVGISQHYGAPLLGPHSYAEYLWRLPYVLAGNTGGYAILALVLPTIFIAIYRGEIHLWVALFALALLTCALAVIYPTAYSLHRDWLEHGTWYRTVFLLNTGAVCAIGVLITRSRSRTIQYIALTLSVPSLAYGGYMTASKWHHTCQRYEAEGRFYLTHPDRLIYSEVPAYWYLEGVRIMYDLPRHHIALADTTLPLAEQLGGFKTVWRWNDGHFSPDADLFKELKDKAQGTP